MGVYNHWQNEHIDTLENPVLCTLCPICGAQKASPKELEIHESTHQTAKAFSCDYCEYKTHAEHNKNAHIRYMHADKVGKKLKIHQCEHYGKQSKNPQNLRKHIEVAHSDFKPDPKYQCHICHKQLKQDNSYRKHMANVHGVGERCEICNKLYKTKEVL